VKSIESSSTSKGDATRQKIIEEAARIFNQRGFAGSSLQDLMTATGLEKGGIYRHFASKEELAAESLKYALARASKIRLDVQHVQGATAKLKFLIGRFVEDPSPLAGGCPLFNAAVDSDDGNAILRGIVAKALKGWKQRLCDIAEEGVRMREFHPGVEPRQLANTIISILEGSLIVSRIEGNKEALRDAQASLNQLVDAAALGCSGA
jgi:TetR/AcrR family transcriptional regulator, transcriptional repressor for nem operon